MTSSRVRGLEEVIKVKKYEKLWRKRAGRVKNGEKGLKRMTSSRVRGLEEVKKVKTCEKL